MSASHQLRTYPPGVPCWIDAEQPDIRAAARFYSALFGWVFEEATPAGVLGTYLIAKADGRDIAAIRQAQDAGSAGGAARWVTYVAVTAADVTAVSVTAADVTAVSVAAAGGSVAAARGSVAGEPQDAGPWGRTVACADPAGSRPEPRRKNPAMS